MGVCVLSLMGAVCVPAMSYDSYEVVNGVFGVCG